MALAVVDGTSAFAHSAHPLLGGGGQALVRDVGLGVGGSGGLVMPVDPISGRGAGAGIRTVWASTPTVAVTPTADADPGRHPDARADEQARPPARGGHRAGGGGG